MKYISRNSILLAGSLEAFSEVGKGFIRNTIYQRFVERIDCLPLFSIGNIPPPP